MPFRKNTISCTFRGNEEIPLLTLKGKWFEKLGFKVGEKVAIYEDIDMIVITKISTEGLETLNNLEKTKKIKTLKRQIKELNN